MGGEGGRGGGGLRYIAEFRSLRTTVPLHFELLNLIVM